MPLDRVLKFSVRMEEPACLHEADADGVLWENKLHDGPEHRLDLVNEQIARANAIQRTLSTMDNRSADVITLRYGLDGVVPGLLKR